ncbi:hypothetical protein RHMOL_Rhmol01G0071900 [Rhododendron molle]|uniref:Uncharacterized protein n=1 Tax=Rhododendron molle TaxID=49168 RepID=A0ACC0PYU6_RHOML|nr:hypothetical protein RHMOL_Rhmol01G0071900 [Rhododendron molle]
MGGLPWLFLFLLCFSQYQLALSSSSLPSFSSSARPLCRRDQRSALLQFKHMFTLNRSASWHCDNYSAIPSYPKTLSWNENATDCCDWDGVTCDGMTGHVIGLDLSCSRLYGEIHPNSSLFQLSHLQRLNLAHNDFDYSPVSQAFGNLASLTHLNLSYSAFSGSIPSEISYLSKLISLDLSSSQLRFEPLRFQIVLKNLSRLQELVLFKVDISSGLPDSLTNLSSLTHLDLSSTGLLGNIPDAFVFLKSLNDLILIHCKLRGPIPPSMGNLTHLRILNLKNNFLDGEVPSTLANLKQLTKLDLSSNLLEGRIPVVFAGLTMLESLDLGHNHFIGGFPLWVANLKPLIYLAINRNQLTGPMPFNISGLQNLATLSLSDNSLSGVMPPWLFTLPSLLYLDLSSNHLTGKIPEFQHDLPLNSIDLSDNKLHGSFPNSISTLVNLTWLSLASNDHLSGVVDLQILKNFEYLSLSNTNLLVIKRSNANNTLPNLKRFYMSSCNIEVFPDFLRTFKKLEALDLSANKIQGEIPNWVGFIWKTSLRYLNLSHNLLIDIKQLPWERLETLDLRFNFLRGPLPIPPRLIRHFFISYNSLSGEIPLSICNASSLEILDLAHNNLSGRVPQCLGNFSSVLLVLNLRSNEFKGTLPLTFAKPNKLRSLDLNENQFEGPLPRSLANCTSLKVLNVGNNMINDTFPDWLGTLPELQVLIVRSNQFHGPISSLMSEFSFPRLQIIDLSSNKFSDRLPGHLPGRFFECFLSMKNVVYDRKLMGNGMGIYYHESHQVTMNGLDIELRGVLNIFTTIDFSSNNFSGEIPQVVGDLYSLKVLNFSHNSLSGHVLTSLGNLLNLGVLDISSNQFTGRIPTFLGDMTTLEVLDISSNKFRGSIPYQLTSLTFLEVLNLSSNSLHGPIPQGYQFNTFENSSYVGNSGLCGIPLSIECRDNDTKVQSPMLQQEEDDSYFDGLFWKIVVIGYGCGMTLGLIIGSLIFSIGRPRFFAKIAEREIPRKVIRLRRTIADTAARRN